MRAVEVMGVRMDVPSNNPVVLLREVGGERVLPIWVGAVEATAIAYVQQGVVPPRPLTHDLMRDIVEANGLDLQSVQIEDLRDGVFYAVLRFASGISVSARPSDAIALALRMGVPILSAESVLDEAGIEMPEDDSDEPESTTPEEEVERFRAFLEDVSPEDFGEQPSG